MAIITLTSDWGTSDYYTAAVKGVILSQIPNATIVDITHEVAHYDIAQAGFKSLLAGWEEAKKTFNQQRGEK